MKKYFLRYVGKSEKEVTKSLYDETFKRKVSGTVSNFKTANGTKGRIENVEESSSYGDEKKEDSLFGSTDFGNFGGSFGGGSDNDYSGGGGDFGGGGSSDSFGGDSGSSD